VLVGYKLDMEHGSSGFHSVLPAHHRSLDPVRIPVDISAVLLVVSVKTAVVDVSPFKAKHSKTGLFCVHCADVVEFMKHFATCSGDLPLYKMSVGQIVTTTTIMLSVFHFHCSLISLRAPLTAQSCLQ